MANSRCVHKQPLKELLKDTDLLWHTLHDTRRGHSSLLKSLYFALRKPFNIAFPVVWLSFWQYHDLLAHISKSLQLKGKSLWIEITPKHVIENLIFCIVRKTFPALKMFLCNTDVLFKALEFPLLKICWANWIFKENNYILNLALPKEHMQGLQSCSL